MLSHTYSYLVAVHNKRTNATVFRPAPLHIMNQQVKALKNANKDGKVTRIVVGTPGRILDLVNDGVCDLSRYVFPIIT